MTKLFISISLMGLAVVTFTSCNKNSEKVIITLPQQLSVTLEKQLNASRQNWNHYAQSLATFRSYQSVKTINTEQEKTEVLQQLLSGESYVAYGNVVDGSTLSLVTVNSLSQQSKASVDTLAKYVLNLVQRGDVVVDIKWEKGSLRFTSKCIVRNDSIVWDNLLTNVIMMDPEGIVVRDSSVDNPAAKYYRKWYKEWRTWSHSSI